MKILDRIDVALYKLREKAAIKKYKKKYPDYEDNECNIGSLQHIWGVTSWDNMTGDSANLYTMNDIDITYDRDAKTYSLSIETIYSFPNDDYGPRDYIQGLFEKLTEWMVSEGRDTNYQLNLYDVFTDGINMNSKFESIEKLYATFKLLVTGFCDSASR